MKDNSLPTPIIGDLFALTGPKGAGKTTLASLLTMQSPNITRMAFATPLRLMLETIGVTSYYHTDNKDLPIPHIPGQPTARRLLQTLGTEWGRNMIYNNLWAELAAAAFSRIREQSYTVIVDDLRFHNEVDVIKEGGGIIVRIMRSGLTGGDDHESEQHWKDIEPDFVVNNNDEPHDTLVEFNRVLKHHMNLKRSKP